MDRLPPHNLDAERWTLGAMLLDGDVVDDVSEFLAPEDFYRDVHASVYRAILALRDRGAPADALHLADELGRVGLLRSVGGDQALSEIMASVPHPSDGPYHARIVREKAVKRRLIESAAEVLRECYDDRETSAALVERAEAGIFAIAEREATAGAVEAIEAVDEALERSRVRAEGGFPGVVTGFVDLDEMIDGLKPRQFVILAARPSIGKTALALDVCSNAALDAGKSVLMVSLEMSREEIGERLVASRGGVDGHKLRTGFGLDRRERERIERVRADVARVPFAIDDAPVRTLSQIAAGARRRKRRRGLDLLVIDYIQLIDARPERGESRQEQVAKMSRRLKTMAKELGIPVLALAQLNRESEKREDRRPRLADLRESGSLEQDADIVMLLHRPEFYDPADMAGMAELIVAKNRNGQTGTVMLSYRKATTRFGNHFPDERPVPINGAPF